MHRSLLARSYARLLCVPPRHNNVFTVPKPRWVNEQERTMWIGSSEQPVATAMPKIAELFDLKSTEVEVFNAQGKVTTTLRSDCRYYVAGESNTNSQDKTAVTSEEWAGIDITGLPPSSDESNTCPRDSEDLLWDMLQIQAVQAQEAKRGLSKEKLHALCSAFRRFDLDGNMYLDYREFCSALSSLGVKADSKALFSTLDRNKDHVISLNEWLELLPSDVASVIIGDVIES